MDAELAALKRIHDAAVELGAKCHRDGGSGLLNDEAAANSYGKSLTELRAQAITSVNAQLIFSAAGRKGWSLWAW